MCTCTHCTHPCTRNTHTPTHPSKCYTQLPAIVLLLILDPSLRLRAFWRVPQTFLLAFWRRQGWLLTLFEQGCDLSKLCVPALEMTQTCLRVVRQRKCSLSQRAPPFLALEYSTKVTLSANGESWFPSVPKEEHWKSVGSHHHQQASILEGELGIFCGKILILSKTSHQSALARPRLKE